MPSSMLEWKIKRIIIIQPQPKGDWKSDIDYLVSTLILWYVKQAFVLDHRLDDVHGTSINRQFRHASMTSCLNVYIPTVSLNICQLSNRSNHLMGCKQNKWVECMLTGAIVFAGIFIPLTRRWESLIYKVFLNIALLIMNLARTLGIDIFLPVRANIWYHFTKYQLRWIAFQGSTY